MSYGTTEEKNILVDFKIGTYMYIVGIGVK